MREKEEKRPWRTEKRSWILYLDELKRFDNILSDNVEGNIYIFDCETARLSIWSEKWQAFADVGVSRFLKQERESKRGHEVENSQATKIFYKGIELQKRYKEIDTELIEFIDIKENLGTDLLNLSRGSLTREGERYLEEEVYPGLLEGIHKVLLHLEQNSQGCFSEIFASNKHWAIRQVRRDRYSGWKMQLVQLDEESNRLYDKLIMFPKSSIQDEELERWADKLCDIGTVDNIQIDSSQQFIMKWLQKNIPTVGMFCSNHGNLRVSIFAPRIYPSIYMNRAFKSLIVERMFQYAEEGIERFSTIAWQGRETLSFNRLPFSLYFVKRGYLSQNSYKKCIVPIHGKKFTQWSGSIKRDLMDLEFKLRELLSALDINQYLYRVKSDGLTCKYNSEIVKYLNFEETDIVMEIVDEFHEIILEKLKEKNFACDVSLSELLKSDDKRFKEWNGIYETAVMLYREEKDGDSGDELLRKIIENTEFDSLCSAWFCVFVSGLPELEKEFEGYKEKIFFLYEDNIIKEAEIKKEQKMVSYIREKGLYPGEGTTIRKNLQAYKKELVDLLFEVEMNPIRSAFKEFNRGLSGYYQKFVYEYEKHRRKDVDEPSR